MCAPLLSKYELHPADRLIHHRGKRGGRGGWVARARWRDTERTKRNVQKETGREEEEDEERWEE